MSNPLSPIARALIALGLVAAALSPAAARESEPRTTPHANARADGGPLVIGHRGTAGHLPEHTLESYALAIALGADFIEPDLVATRDGHLIARHEPNLIATTNVASLPQFADRKRTVVVDGAAETGFFASDFTLAEIRTLRAVQAVGVRDHRFDGQFAIPTFEEVIALAQRKAKETGRTVGIYPETKHPTYHQNLGLPLEDRLLAALDQAGWNHRDAPVYIQSFETANLKYLRGKTRVKLVQLVDANDLNADGSLDFTAPFDRPYDWTAQGRAGLFKDLLTPAGLDEVKTYADGIGPWKYYLLPSACAAGVPSCGEADRTRLPGTQVVADAHARGLVVHPYTFRNEAGRLPKDDRGDPTQEYIAFFQHGVDGVFSDFADTAVAAREMFRLATEPGYARCLTQGKGCAADRRKD